MEIITESRKIKDSGEARYIHEKLIFYSGDQCNLDAKIIDSSAEREGDKLKDKYVIQLENSCIKLCLYELHDEQWLRKFGGETLDIEISGGREELESSKKRLEEITGIPKIFDY